MNTTVAHQLRQIIKPQAPYTVVALMLDGSLICPTCTESHATRIIRSTHEYRRGWPDDGWTLAAAYHHAEGRAQMCAHCSDFIQPDHWLLTASWVDTCLSCYWTGHHAPHIQIPITPSTTVADLLAEGLSELNQGAVAQLWPSQDADVWYDAARDALQRFADDLRKMPDRPADDLLGVIPARDWPEDDDELDCMEWPYIYITFE